MKSLPLLTLPALLALLVLSGCGGIGPAVPPAPEAAIAVIDAVDADTNEPLAVEAQAIVGGVRGTITLAEGSVVLRNVPFGSGTPPTQPLTVTAPGYVTFAEPIQISLTVVTFFTATMEPADLNETGTMTGKITDTAGNPLTSALVKFTNVGPGGTTEVRGYTDSRGEYIIGGIPIGVNTITAEAPGYVTGTERATVVQDAGGGTNQPVNVSLIPGDTELEVAGTVKDAFTNTPLPGATVKFGQVATVQTDARGEFTVQEVPVGTHAVEITVSGYDKVEQEVTVLPGMGRLTFGMTVAAPEPPGGPYNLEGMVTVNNRPDNSGVVVTAVAVASARELGRVTTPASGVYTMFLPPGEYRVTATYETRSVRRTVDVPSGGRILRGVDFILTADPLPASAAAKLYRCQT